jgi:O-methyltransferase
MRLAWSTFRYLFDFEYYAFDSFKGLPKIDSNSIDSSEIFYSGNLSTSVSKFRRIVSERGQGIPENKMHVIEGFYVDSLTDGIQRLLKDKQVRVIMIDCDLYSSTKTVLDFLTPIIKKNTIVIFDDWNCYGASDEKGERLAFKEFVLKNPNFRFNAFVSTGEAMSFVCVDSPNVSKAH